MNVMDAGTNSDAAETRREVSTSAADTRRALQAQEPMLFCPVCSLRLSERKCKLFCERCGYYMSCSDYY